MRFKHFRHIIISLILIKHRVSGKKKKTLAAHLLWTVITRRLMDMVILERKRLTRLAERVDGIE